MYMGSNMQGVEKCSGQLLILLCINYRQNDAQEFCIPSYLHFIWLLEGTYIELIYVSCPMHDVLVGFFVNDVDFFVFEKC